MTMTVLRATAEQQKLDVSPGVLGFLVTLAVVLACIPLFRSMTSKIRGVQYRDNGGAGGAEGAAAVVPTPDARSEAQSEAPPDGPHDAPPGTSAV